VANREAIGGLFAAYFREIKMWLYRATINTTKNELEALQRSTLHESKSHLDESSVIKVVVATGVSIAQSCDVACERGVKIYLRPSLPYSKQRCCMKGQS